MHGQQNIKKALMSFHFWLCRYPTCVFVEYFRYLCW